MFYDYELTEEIPQWTCEISLSDLKFNLIMRRFLYSSDSERFLLNADNINSTSALITVDDDVETQLLDIVESEKLKLKAPDVAAHLHRLFHVIWKN